MKLQALVVPYDSGFRGLRMGAGPERLLKSGILDGLGNAHRPLDVSVHTFEGAKGGLRGEVASAFEIQQWLATHVSSAREESAFPLVLAGNCITAAGTIGGLQARSRRVPGVCWLDAHADFNTPETTDSGFLDGMALATLTGRCWRQLTRKIPGFRPIPESQVLLFGARNLDAGERRLLDESEVHWIKPPYHGEGPSATLRTLRQRFGEVYLHIDLDVIDAAEGRANSYASAGGISRARLLDLVREISTTFHVGAAAITAYDPSCDPENRIPGIAKDVVRALSEVMA